MVLRLRSSTPSKVELGSLKQTSFIIHYLSGKPEEVWGHSSQMLTIRSSELPLRNAPNGIPRVNTSRLISIDRVAR
jgi:hypothetical protein